MYAQPCAELFTSNLPAFKFVWMFVSATKHFDTYGFFNVKYLKILCCEIDKSCGIDWKSFKEMGGAL